jgi:hypothetical protein
MKTIKKGQRFLCLKDYIMDYGAVAYKSGQIYEASGKDILPSNVDSTHCMYRSDDFDEHFKRVKNNPEAYIQNIPVIFETVKQDSIVDSVIKKFKDRSDVGIKKYGTTLAGNDKLTTLQWIDEAQAEAMDFCLYLERLKKEF